MGRKKQPGVFEEEYRLIGGIEQYLLHYPAAANAPVALFLHGGPGTPESLLGHLFRQWWGDMFTVVHWDQRGCGKTLTRNPQFHTYPISFDVLQSDIGEIVQYLKTRYNAPKIVIMGHSWGTVLGSVYTKEHPEDVQMYIGVGQVVNMAQNEAAGFAKARELAALAGDKQSLKRLDAVGEYPGMGAGFEPGEWTKKAKVVRKIQQKYGIAMGLNSELIKMVGSSPVMGLKDIAAMVRSAKACGSLLDFLVEFDLNRYTKPFEVPVSCIMGENDYQTVMPLAVEYFQAVPAPQKQIHIIPGAGHNTMCDAPELFAKALAQTKEMLA